MNLMIFSFLILGISIISTMLMKNIALRYGILDKPDKERKIHKEVIPLLGGVAVFIALFTGILIGKEFIFARGLSEAQILGFFFGGLALVIGGVLDDIYELKPGKQMLFSVLAVAILIFSGVSIEKVTNPFGGLLYFGVFLSYVLTFVWVIGMIYTTKLLDGVDGLVSGLGVISGIIIFLFTMTTKYYQPDVGIMALIFSLACAGFLLFNFYPAKIFLGESGSLFIGYVIAVLAIISGAKIAVALLVMGIPIMDVAWTIIRRIADKKNPFKSADKQHLHHKFLAMGLSQRQTVLIYYILAAFFGCLALFLQSRGKIIAIVILAVIMVFIAFLSVFIPRKNKSA
ncbi:hypothetical protein COT95_02070 [Candidatus Falkowbacteria bacterium CG10_big_fil_rev_8_21_14_0_10_37_6]|uniref:Undecaprenyl-phosphate alpha-N-acetylglucosaminyl 1-phosphate transferase n=1 Tax=Candidatus Falkowbacteria bacterium CG10_big_fil_rev_8_21_14_0_10_37_6 TaxID=1974563 RepID=A0A2H0V6Z5_9BACT|nr:MAG: hypothetical protein COT95_02070 [Candidatus Falkowbacteria bacterium CG10_big_fil_rev_8_21_14_0_10_37_6]